MESLRLTRSDCAPLVVLTEGKSDASILSRALEILYPHLTDVVKFMDYNLRPESNAGALVGLVKSFAAAGIAIRIVAVFDNDCAAPEALRQLTKNNLPRNIRVIQYPDIPLGKSYPTLDPALTPPGGAEIVFADVNGRAGSIELYLGRDVLCIDGCNLTPVQWRHYNHKLDKRHGKITQKRRLQERFKEKAKRAEEDSGLIQNQDWEGLRAILEEIKKPFC